MARTEQKIPDSAPERRRWERNGPSAPRARAASSGKAGSRLVEVKDFGSNPGDLRMLTHVPRGLEAKSPLVVVLHGCTQDAAGYDEHAGWTRLADAAGFAVLYPEQKASNNPQGCFNWFRTGDTARGLGETLSIHEMIERMIARQKIDPKRVFVTGLSAGGAMAASLLAGYPETFAGGAVIAGLPCGVATSLQEALQAMALPHERSAGQLGDIVRAGSTHKGPWPVISIWHGSADTTVAPRNAEEIIKQWTDVHGAPIGDFREETDGGHQRRVWRVGGRDVVEAHTITGMGHGAPLDSRLGERKGPFMLDAGVSSTRRIAAFWGIADAAPAVAQRPAAETARASAQASPPPPPRRSAGPEQATEHDAQWRGGQIGETIMRALRAAGLTR